MLAVSAFAIEQKKASRNAPINRLAVPSTQPLARSSLPVQVVRSAGSGQTGYVHYFLITHTDGSTEYQPGIETDDGRIAWSFPDVGASVMPFIAKGPLEIDGRTYEIQHLYGIRPFPDAARMQTLKKELAARVALLIDSETPYCVFRTPNEPFCLNCGDFVLRILFPGRTVLTPALPKDLSHVAPDGSASADDLLLYLLGLFDLPNKAARLKRIGELALPDTLREDALQLVEATGTGTPAISKQIQAKPVAPTRPAMRVTRPPGKMVQDKMQRKRL